MNDLQRLEFAHQFNRVSLVPVLLFFVIVLEHLFYFPVFVHYSLHLAFLYVLYQFFLWHFSRVLEPSEERGNLAPGGSFSVFKARNRPFVELIRGVEGHIVHIKFERLCVPLGESIVSDDTFKTYVFQLNGCSFSV